ncbi:hypothetical protein ACS0TY_003723 [Phlomoides rotata]
MPSQVEGIYVNHNGVVESKELKKLGVDVKVVHNASFMNEIGVCGLQLYGYGETISKPFFTETWRHDIKIKRN